MANENDKQDDRIDNEPEYHFSDEEDFSEASSAQDTTSSTTTRTTDTAKHLMPPKRVLVSIAVFLSLVFAVYKMVAPVTPDRARADTITPVTPLVSKQSQAIPATPTALSTTPPIATTPDTTAPAPVSSVVTASVATTPQAPPVTTMQPVETTAPSQAMLSPTTATLPAGQQPTQPTPQTTHAVLLSQAAQAAAETEGILSLAPTTTAIAATSVATPSPAPAVPAALPIAAGAAATLEADSARLQNQMNVEYLQRLNDFSEQNKALQSQIQTLNARMLTMEAQLNQLMQSMLHTQPIANSGTNDNMPVTSATPESFVQVPKVSYTVQAIIPGRAWLKSETGDVLTVAEGETIKDFGKVVKINPYDGVVEVDAGHKIVSLSYGIGA